jgi:ribosomal protein S18 acetylase RimI-like enzyme
MSIETQPLDRHIRSIDLKKDLAKIADLIDICFLDHMDSEGQDYLHHMRLIARNTLYLQYAGSSPETSAYPFNGYVWEENGEVIGNLTLIYLRRRNTNSYFIANVAVHPDQRGRGIARQLTERALRHVAEHNGSTVYLQVREDNPTARHIYVSAGFNEFARRTTWRFTSSPAFKQDNSRPFGVIRTHPKDWEQHKDWLLELYPPTISWNLSFQIRHLEPGLAAWLRNFSNGIHVRNWALQLDNRLHGILSWEKGAFKADNLWLATSPVWEEEVISTLIPFVRQHLAKPARAYLNYPASRSPEAFLRAGMENFQTLLWMEKSIPHSGR